MSAPTAHSAAIAADAGRQTADRAGAQERDRERQRETERARECKRGISSAVVCTQTPEEETEYV